MLRHLQFGHAARQAVALRAGRRRDVLCRRARRDRARATIAISPRMRPRWSMSITTSLPAVADCRKAVRGRRADGAARARLQCRGVLQGRLRRCRGGVRQGRARVPRGALAASRRRAFDRRAAASLAEYRGADDAITVWASTQKSHDLRQSLAGLLDLDETPLRVATPDVGGGFGPKLCVYPEDVAVVAARDAAQALDQMGRGPARAFHSTRRRSATSTGRSRSRSTPTAACSASAAGCCTISAPMRCRT